MTTTTDEIKKYANPANRVHTHTWKCIEYGILKCTICGRIQYAVTHKVD